jgi:hypothetical protein
MKVEDEARGKLLELQGKIEAAEFVNAHETAVTRIL